MLLKRLISIFFILVYTVIVVHDFVPHHHHTDACEMHHHAGDHQSEPCKFPFHQHDMEDAGVFLNTPAANLEFDITNLGVQCVVEYSDIILSGCFNNQIDFILLVYKGPYPTSLSFRGPPLS